MSSHPPPCRCSTRIRWSGRGWRAPRRRPTTSTPWSVPWSGSAPVSSRRWCSRARCAPTPRPTTTRPPCSERSARSSRPATAGASARPRRRSSARAPSCSCAATASAPRPSRSAGTTRRSADPAVDDHLGEQLLQSAKDREEQAIVARRIERTLEPVSLWVAAAERAGAREGAERAAPRHADPRPARATRCRRWSSPASCCRRRRSGGEPREAALPLIPALEGLDRGWYAGAVGWTDLAEDGEFCVALRCALLRGRVAHLYAGCGIVRDSVPAEELAETEVKLQALLPLAVLIRRACACECPVNGVSGPNERSWGRAAHGGQSGSQEASIGARTGPPGSRRRRDPAVHGRRRLPRDRGVRERRAARQGQRGEGGRRHRRERQGHRRDPGRARQGDARRSTTRTTSRSATARR